MMRRHSPPRFPRRNSPPRRSGRLRSLSPLSRSQPAPPGEERGRKLNPWETPGAHKRVRSRSRSKERLGGRNRENDKVRRDRELHSEDERHKDRFDRGREVPRNLPRKERERSRERQIREKNNFQNNKQQHQRKFSHEPQHNHTESFEENYLQNDRNLFIGANFTEPITDPSGINLNNFVPDVRHSREPARETHPPIENTREIHHSHRNHHNKHDNKEETAEERINRLEKLVEKLVEGGPSKQKNNTFHQPSSKDSIPELIPSITQFTTSKWINKIHDECIQRNFDERSIIRFMQEKMTGIMKAWFKTVSSYDFTWPELKLLITKTFPDNIDFATTLKLLVGRDKRADETLTQYFFSKLYLCEACKITGENAVSCLIDGLNNPFMKQEIKKHNFFTPEALYSEYLSKMEDAEVPLHIDNRDVREVVSDHQIDDFIPLERGENNFRVSRSERAGDYLPEHHLGRGPTRPKCFTCKKIGHETVDCRHAPICYKCGKKGHIAVKCHSKG